KHSSPREAAWTVQLWPIVAPGPTSVPWRGVTCTTAQSCTFAPRRTTIGLKSARSTALYHTDAFSSTVTSPTSTAVGATNADGWTFGLLPSKLNSGMVWTLAVCSDCSHLTRSLGEGRCECRPDIQRVHVGDTGCASAMVALQQASNYLRAFPGRRALVLSAEICSAAYFLDDRLESAVAHAIFADGAAAVTLTTGGSGPAIVA